MVRPKVCENIIDIKNMHVHIDNLYDSRHR